MNYKTKAKINLKIIIKRSAFLALSIGAGLLTNQFLIDELGLFFRICVSFVISLLVFLILSILAYLFD